MSLSSERKSCFDLQYKLYRGRNDRRDIQSGAP
jgi:hypothetical protein